MPQQEDAPADDFTIGQLTRTPDINDTDLRYANDERQVLLADWLPHPGLSAGGAAACSPRNNTQSPTSITHPIKRESAFASLVALMTAHQR